MRRKLFSGIGLAFILTLILEISAVAQGQFKTLYSFDVSDGAYNAQILLLDAAGNVYGVTGIGGAYASGTVFKLTPNADGSWTQNVIYTFTGGSDGGGPLGNLIFDAAGDLYGTANSGTYPYPWGNVFKLTPNPDGSWTESTLYSFTGGPDGWSPTAGVAFDTAGNLYGTTQEGGDFA